MSIAADIIVRLQALDPSPFRIVAGAAAFAALTGEPKAAPAAFVLLEEEQSGDNERATGPVLQRTEADIAVIIVTRNVSDGTGSAAAGDIEALKAVVRAALIGFVPPSAAGGDPMTHISGNLIRAKSGAVWQRELFAASYLQMES